MFSAVTGPPAPSPGITSSKGPSSFFHRRPLRPSMVNNSRRRLPINTNSVASLSNINFNVPSLTSTELNDLAELPGETPVAGPYVRRSSIGSELAGLPLSNSGYNINASDMALLNSSRKARIAAMTAQPSVARQPGFVGRPSVLGQPSVGRPSVGLVRQPSVGLVRQPSVLGQPSVVQPAVVPPGSYVLPMEANVEEVHLDPKVIFPDAVTHITDLKDKISKVTKDIEAMRPGLKSAITAAQALGVLNIGDKSFRGKNNPLVYVAHNTNVNDFVVRGDFTVDGRPFRVINEDSFNSVLSQMKQKKQTAKTAIKGLGEVQDKVKGLEGLLASLRQDLDKSTKKLRSNMRNYTAKHAKGMMRGLKPTTRVVPSANVRAAEALLQPQPPKSLWQRMTGRGGRAKKNATRKTNRR